MVQTVVRKLTLDDLDEYQVCRLDALRDAPSAFASSYEEEAVRTADDVREIFMKRIASGDNTTFGAFDGKRLVGLTGIFREERQKRRHKMTIVSVFVRPEYRGKKIGSILVHRAIAHARTVDGVERIELSVESGNAAAKALYISCGLATWGTEPAFSKIDGVEYDEDCMTLKL